MKLPSIKQISSTLSKAVLDISSLDFALSNRSKLNHKHSDLLGKDKAAHLFEKKGHDHPLPEHDHEHDHDLPEHEHKHEHDLPEHDHPLEKHDHPLEKHDHPLGEHDHPLPEHKHPVLEQDLPEHEHPHEHELEEHEHEYVKPEALNGWAVRVKDELVRLKAKFKEPLKKHGSTHIADDSIPIVTKDHKGLMSPALLRRFGAYGRQIGAIAAGGIQELNEHINNHPSGAITKADVEGVLTGEISSHTHGADTTLGTMTADIDMSGNALEAVSEIDTESLLVLGPELITYTDFTDNSAWNVDDLTEWAEIEDGTNYCTKVTGGANLVSDSTTAFYLSKDYTMIVGKQYQIAVDIVSATGAFKIANNAGAWEILHTTSSGETGLITINVTASGTTLLLGYSSDAANNHVIASVSCREVLQDVSTDGHSVYQEVDMGSNKLTDVADPTSDQDAATKIYADNRVIVSVTEPSNPSSGDIWIDISSPVLPDPSPSSYIAIGVP